MQKISFPKKLITCALAGLVIGASCKEDGMEFITKGIMRWK